MKKLFLALSAIILLSSCVGGAKLTEAEATATVEMYNTIIEYAMQQQIKLDITTPISEGKSFLNEINSAGLYKFAVNETDSYLTKDGKYMIQVIDLEDEDYLKNKAEVEKLIESKKIVKSDKPQVDLFVMSHCPYGTQAEKGILPVAKLLGDKIDFDIKFCDYAMHGEVEVKEQINQYCINTEQNEKFIPYMDCFLADGNTERCLKETDIDQTKLNTCFEVTDQKYELTKMLADKSTYVNGKFPAFTIHQELVDKYQIAGSPTLVINEKEVDGVGRNPNSLLQAICSAFENPPEECSTELSGANPSAGFGYEEGAAPVTAGSCS